jgi:hypothetical protein
LREFRRALFLWRRDAGCLHDDEGDVYAIVVYGDGEPETSFIKKANLEAGEQQLAEIERDRASIFRRRSQTL